MLASAAGNDSGIPQAILDAKAEEVRKRKEVQDAITVRLQQPYAACLQTCMGTCMLVAGSRLKRHPHQLAGIIQVASPCLSTAGSPERRQQRTCKAPVAGAMLRAAQTPLWSPRHHEVFMQLTLAACRAGAAEAGAGEAGRGGAGAGGGGPEAPPRGARGRGPLPPRPRQVAGASQPFIAAACSAS